MAEPAASCRVGVDLASVAEVERSLRHFGDRYARRLFTDHELASVAGSDDPAASLAARFAAKEAVIKVLEPSGSRPAWRDIEVRRRRNGACRLRLHGRAASLAHARGIAGMSVSLSHEAGLAVAVVAASVPTSPAEPITCVGTASRRTDGAPSAHHHPPDTRSNDMTSEETTQQIRNVLREHARLPVDVATLSDDDDLFQAGMTSHASVNVMLALEDAFDVEFPEAMLRKATFSSVGALRRALVELEAMEVSV